MAVLSNHTLQLTMIISHIPVFTQFRIKGHLDPLPLNGDSYH